MDAQLLLDAKATLGEGPLWDERKGVLYWVDILGQKLHRYNPSSQTNDSFHVGQDVGTVVLDEAGGVLLAVRDGFARFDLATETVSMIAEPDNKPENNRFNDGKASPGGRFWAGTMAYDVAPYMGSLYCLDTDGTIHTKESDVTISNGIVWSADHQIMYYIDSPARVVTAYQYDKATGTIDQGKIVIKVPDNIGTPDGMAIDNKDQLWIAHWGSGEIICWCPKTGEKITSISVPSSHTTACAFGGANMSTLYITTARVGLSDEQLVNEPHAGGLFVVETDVVGLASHRYQG